MKKVNNNLTATNQGLYEKIYDIEIKLYNAHQVEVFIYDVLCIFWFIYH